MYKTQLLLQFLLLTVRGDLLERIEVALNSKEKKITGSGVYTRALATKKNDLFLVCIFILAPTKSLMHDKHEAFVVCYTTLRWVALRLHRPREKMELLVLLSMFISC